ncbi:DUF4236 domain-containing protein [Streptomyces ochraceiscleroticus]|uniref:DUF4236 domain-containing protein n=2 Tax=Streptomyces ochraceiscleroticus TaxID=47761 RepID=A0ABW1MDH0_9ACTN|nr:DUF4236 domain-containing protein [Streptomyces ochraceiscleroticus]
MGFRINRSFKVAPGVRLRFGNKSSSLSVGGKAGRVTLNSRGRRTTTVRLAPGVSYTLSSGKRPKRSRAVSGTPAPLTANAPLRALIAPRRNITDGWVAADDRGVVVHRRGLDDFRIPLVQLVSAELDGKELALKASDGTTYRLCLVTFSAARDLRFVETVARAAELTVNHDVSVLLSPALGVRSECGPPASASGRVGRAGPRTDARIWRCRCHPWMPAGTSAFCGSCASSPCAGPHRTQTTVPGGLGTWTSRSLPIAGTAPLPWSGRHTSPCCFPLRSRNAVREVLENVARLSPIGKARAGSVGCTRAHVDAISSGSSGDLGPLGA